MPVKPFFSFFSFTSIKEFICCGKHPEEHETSGRCFVFIGEVVMAMGAQTMLLNDAVTKRKTRASGQK